MQGKILWAAKSAKNTSICKALPFIQIQYKLISFIQILQSVNVIKKVTQNRTQRRSGT